MSDSISDNKDLTGKTFKGIHSQTVIVAVKAILSLSYFSIMSRLLTPEDFGYFALITAVTTILSSLSEAGLGSSVIQRKNPDEGYISTAFTLSIISGLLFCAILNFGANIFSSWVIGSNKLSLAFHLMSVILICQSINNIISALYMRNLNFLRYGVLQICSDLTSDIIGISIAYSGYGYYAIVLAVVFNNLILTIIFLILGKVRFRFLLIRQYIKDIIGYGGWLTASVILRNLTDEIDKIIIAKFLPISQLGAINRPQGFVSRITIQINGIFDTVLFPILSEIREDGDKIARAYINIMSLTVTFSLFIASGLLLSSNLIINIFFGSQWLYLRNILIIFSFAALINGASRIADSFFRSLGIVKKYFLTRIINWGIYVISVIIGCKYGILGVSIGMVSGTLFSLIIKYLMQFKDVGVNTYSLLITIFKNILTPLLVFTVFFLLEILFNVSEIFCILGFLVSILVTMISFPSIYGRLFRINVIDRYLLRMKKFRIF